MLTKNMSNIVNSSIYKNYMNFISIPFNYIEKYNTVTAEYTKQVLQELFDEKNMILSVVRGK